MDKSLDTEKTREVVVRNAALSVALVAGIGGAVLKVWNHFYQNMKDRGPLDD